MRTDDIKRGHAFGRPGQGRSTRYADKRRQPRSAEKHALREEVSEYRDPMKSEAYHQGYDAFMNGSSLRSNPYDEALPEHDEWEKGWLESSFDYPGDGDVCDN